MKCDYCDSDLGRIDPINFPLVLCTNCDRTAKLVGMGVEFLKDKNYPLTDEQIREISESFITFCSGEFKIGDLATSYTVMENCNEGYFIGEEVK